MTVLNESVLSINPRLFVLDLDRCLLNDQIYTLFEQVIAEAQFVNTELLQQARRKLEASGGSFDSIGWLQTQEGFGEREYNQLVHEFISRAHDKKTDTFLSSGARLLLNTLELLEIPHIIVTYGGREYQEAKLKAAKLDAIPYQVVDRKHKAGYIAEWWNETHEWFETTVAKTTYRAEAVVLVDDKANAFDNLPAAPRARGYWLQTAPLLASQEGMVPSNVTIIRDLKEVMINEGLATR